MVTINYNTVQGYKTLDSETIRFSNGETRERQFQLAKEHAIEACERCWDTDIFTLIFDKGESHLDVRGYSSSGKLI